MRSNVVISHKFTSNFLGIPFDCILKDLFCLLYSKNIKFNFEYNQIYMKNLAKLNFI